MFASNPICDPWVVVMVRPVTSVADASRLFDPKRQRSRGPEPDKKCDGSKRRGDVKTRPGKSGNFRIHFWPCDWFLCGIPSPRVIISFPQVCSRENPIFGHEPKPKELLNQKCGEFAAIVVHTM